LQNNKEDENLTAEELALTIKKILEDKKALNVEIIDVADKTILADRFVIATGTSVTHIKALAGEVEYEVKEQLHRVPDHVEGYSSARWILLDYEDVIVHIFHQDERDFYSLEKLWKASRGPAQVLPQA
jgi:ribosome-associated protein